MSSMFRDQHVKYIENQAIVHEESSRTFPLPLRIENAGGAPAHKLTVSIAFPPEKVSAAAIGLQGTGKRVKPMSGFRGVYEPERILIRPENLELLDTGFQGGGYRLQPDKLIFEWHALAHDEEMDLRTLWLTLAKWPDPTDSLALTVKVHAIDPPISITYRVRVLVTAIPPQ